ncbi:hypothetical protein D6C86_07213 [Aureobasidium pullulans]|nr:hypothetical protein D6C86_07213 [Aureobasidium pullulans]
MVSHESGLYALAIGMVAHPDNTQPVDWSGRSPENTAFARLVYAIHQIRSQHDDNSVKLETLRVDNSTMSFQGLASLIAHHNQTMAEPKIELFLAEMGRIEAKTPHLPDSKKVVVRRSPQTRQWEGCGYADTAYKGEYVDHHESQHDHAKVTYELGCFKVIITPGDGYHSALFGLAMAITGSEDFEMREMEGFEDLKRCLDGTIYKDSATAELKGPLSSKVLGAVADSWNRRCGSNHAKKISLYTGYIGGKFQEVTMQTTEERKRVIFVYQDSRWSLCLSRQSSPFDSEGKRKTDLANNPIPVHEKNVSVAAEKIDVVEDVAESHQALARVVERLEATSCEQINTINGLVMAVNDLTATVAALTNAMQTNGKSSVQQLDHMDPEVDEEVEVADLISFD